MTQPNFCITEVYSRCELLSFLSIFEIWHNSPTKRIRTAVVVNCFHFWVSLRYDTTHRERCCRVIWLWIAFIFEYLWDMTQLRKNVWRKSMCCELLSFLSIFEIWHNKQIRFDLDHIVVNCFHFWVSLRYDTTALRIESWFALLWIAFIFEYLWDMTQLCFCFWLHCRCCELLSFLSIFEIWHNRIYFYLELIVVVNCFHFWVSLRYDTTSETVCTIAASLWIAFIFEYLWDMTQLNHFVVSLWHRCELLSFLSIFEIWHNWFHALFLRVVVVNCFHFWVSLRYDTTSGGYGWRKE